VILLLPPSETKRDGGTDGTALDLAALSYPALHGHRRATVAALRALSRNVAESATALKLSDKQRFEIERNRVLHSSPLMPVMDRFTGVLFEALDAPTLDEGARDWLARHAVVHSALFGLVGAGDLIPAYRLSQDSRLPELSLKKHWSAAIAAELASVDGLTLDLRSEGYVALGAAGEGSFYVRVVSAASDGTKKALNHFNKKGKGEFVRALATAGIDHPDVESLLAWAPQAGIRLERVAPVDSATASSRPGAAYRRGMLDLVV